LRKKTRYYDFSREGQEQGRLPFSVGKYNLMREGKPRRLSQKARGISAETPRAFYENFFMCNPTDYGKMPFLPQDIFS
jgi:hypothetical protein